MNNSVGETKARSYVISMENRKRRGSGCERPAEILKAARELFLEHGVENVTTRQIAARVGISQTALYVYFTNKEQILDSLAKDSWRGLAASLDAIEGQGENDPGARLRAILAAFMRYWLRRPDDFRIVVMRRALRSGDQQNDTAVLCHNLLNRIASRAKEAADAGVLECDCAEAVALTMWTAVSGAVALRLAYPELLWPPEEKHIETTLDLIFRGCQAPPTPQAAEKAGARIAAKVASRLTDADLPLPPLAPVEP